MRKEQAQTNRPPGERQITDGLRELRRMENLSVPEIREIERRFLEMDGRFLDDPLEGRVREVSRAAFGDAWLMCAGSLIDDSSESRFVEESDRVKATR